MRYKLILPVLIVFMTITKAQSNQNVADEVFDLGNYIKAIELYKGSNDLEQVYDKIAKAYVAIGNYGKGLDYYLKATEANPDNHLITYEYAKLLRRTKRYQEAKDLFDHLITLDSINPNYYYEKGIALEKLSDTASFDAFKKTYELDQSHQKAIFKIAKRHIFKRRFKEAHQIIDEGLKSYSENVELISLKAQAYYYQEYYTHAVDWFNKLIILNETSEFIHEKLSLSYAQNSDYEDAIFHRKEALKYNPNDANAMFVIGTYYEHLSNYKKAEEYYKKSLFLRDVSLSNEYQKLGYVLNRQKRYKEAIEAYQKAYKEDPSDIMTEFFILRTKDEYYEDVDAKIKLYEKFLNKHEKTPFKMFADRRLNELKKQKFLREE
jgi:tetratricopeptide (TPR) repeat protein